MGQKWMMERKWKGRWVKIKVEKSVEEQMGQWIAGGGRDERHMREREREWQKGDDWKMLKGNAQVPPRD